MRVLYSGNMSPENADPVESFSVLSISDGLVKIAEYSVFSKDIFYLLRLRVGWVRLDGGGVYIFC